MLKSFSMLVLLAASVPAFAAAPASSDGKAKDPKRKVCKSVEETGSRLSSKRICMTAEQWEAQLNPKRSDKPAGTVAGK